MLNYQRVSSSHQQKNVSVFIYCIVWYPNIFQRRIWTNFSAWWNRTYLDWRIAVLDARRVSLKIHVPHGNFPPMLRQHHMGMSRRTLCCSLNGDICVLFHDQPCLWYLWNLRPMVGSTSKQRHKKVSTWRLLSCVSLLRLQDFSHHQSLWSWGITVQNVFQPSSRHPPALWDLTSLGQPWPMQPDLLASPAAEAALRRPVQAASPVIPPCRHHSASPRRGWLPAWPGVVWASATPYQVVADRLVASNPSRGSASASIPPCCWCGGAHSCAACGPSGYCSSNTCQSSHHRIASAWLFDSTSSQVTYPWLVAASESTQLVYTTKFLTFLPVVHL